MIYIRQRGLKNYKLKNLHAKSCKQKSKKKNKDKVPAEPSQNRGRPLRELTRIKETKSRGDQIVDMIVNYFSEPDAVTVCQKKGSG